MIYAVTAAVFVAAGMLAAGAEGAPEKPSRPFASFESREDLAKVQAHDVGLSLQAEGSTDGKQALRIEFGKVEWPNAMWRAGETPWDWRGFGWLAVDVHNPGQEAVSFAIRIDDDASADGIKHCISGNGGIAAGARGSFAVPFANTDPMASGMRGLPMPKGVASMGAHGNPIDAGHVVAFQIFLPRPAKPQTLVVDNIRLLPATSLEGIIDAYGQYTGYDWPGKVKSDADFARQRAAEEAAIHKEPVLPGRDEYGGWADGPKLNATGFFRTEQRDAKWWLVTPGGRLFFSVGVDCVWPGEQTFVEGRDTWFTSLPKEGEPLARYYGKVDWVHSGPIKSGRTYDFASANLHRKYGPDFFTAWRDTALDRLRHWGFNTIANWSDARLWEAKRVPYTVSLGVGGEHKRLASGSDYWGKMHDPFDPQFAVDADNAFRDRARAAKDDPWCIGYFVDNELSWGGEYDDKLRYGLARGALRAGPDQPAQAAFIAQLKGKYESIDRLNAAWNTRFASWEALAQQPAEVTDPMNAAMKDDMGAFVQAFALKYFTVVRDALRKYDPNHLYLGCRFAWATPEAVSAAAQVCDVVSFNIYRRRLDPEPWDRTKELGKPCIIGEFHFGALDRGMFHTGLVSVEDQAARGRAYQEYVRDVMDHPAFVGCHWFQYKDEPTTGRWFDGENYNIGFVTVTDTPYPELVAAAREVHAEVYRRRAGR